MTTEEILNLDYRKEESKTKIQKVLRKIKPLSKYSEEDDIPLVDYALYHLYQVHQKNQIAFSMKNMISFAMKQLKKILPIQIP